VNVDCRLYVKLHRSDQKSHTCAVTGAAAWWTQCNVGLQPGS